MTSHVTVKHSFETGHRLPHLAGKCQSLHGHSWQVQVTVSGTLDPLLGVLVEFAALKKHLRGWIDAHLDHGLMLGVDDPLLPRLTPYGKTFGFGRGETGAEQYAVDLLWPTVENVAALLARVMDDWLLAQGLGDTLVVTRCAVQETAVNEAAWTP